MKKHVPLQSLHKIFSAVLIPLLIITSCSLVFIPTAYAEPTFDPTLRLGRLEEKDEGIPPSDSSDDNKLILDDSAPTNPDSSSTSPTIRSSIKTGSSSASSSTSGTTSTINDSSPDSAATTTDKQQTSDADFSSYASNAYQQAVKIKHIEVQTNDVLITQLPDIPDTLQPPNVDAADGYYYHITGNIRFEPASITFATEKGVEPTALVLIKTPRLLTSLQFYQDEWKEIPLTAVYEDENLAYYNVQINPCSSAIVFISIDDSYTMQPYTAELFVIPTTALIGIIILTSILLIIVLFKAGYIYYEDDQSTGQSRYVISYKKKRTTPAVKQHYRHLRHFTKKSVPHSKIYTCAMTLKIFLHFFIAIIW